MRAHVIAELMPEPVFELPPRLSSPTERRLSGRAVAAWNASCRNGRPPSAVDFLSSELALFCAGSSAGLIATASGICLSSVGTAVATSFGLACGKLPQSSPLGDRLRAAFADFRRRRAPVSFEAAFAGRADRQGGSAALLLTRGVVLPLLDHTGALTQALAILTWREPLGEGACKRLYGEMDGAITAARAVWPRQAALAGTALHEVFGAVPGPALAVRQTPSNGSATVSPLASLVPATPPTHKRP